jgi:hypothetical protein
VRVQGPRIGQSEIKSLPAESLFVSAVSPVNGTSHVVESNEQSMCVTSTASGVARASATEKTFTWSPDSNLVLCRE